MTLHAVVALRLARSYETVDFGSEDAAHAGVAYRRARTIDAGLHVDTSPLCTMHRMNRFILTIAISLASAVLLMLSVPAGAAAGDEWSALQLLGTPSNR